MGERIVEVTAWQALDSRGNPTVAARIETATGSGVAIAPAGASAGSHEAVFIRDASDSYSGRSVSQHLASVFPRVRAALLGLDAGNPEEIDTALRDIDPDPLMRLIGGNVATAVSVAAWLAHADALSESPWVSISSYLGVTPSIPLPMVNIISGGAHADGMIDIQDVLAVPVGARSFAEAIEWCWLTRLGTQQVMNAAGFNTALVADEGGLAAPFRNDEEALATVVAGIERAGLRPGVDVCLALDVAASECLTESGYRMGGKQVSSSEFVQRLVSWRSMFPIVSLEDGAGEDDDGGWQEMSVLATNTQILGDDRYVTSYKRLMEGISRKEANAILIKPNQAGTLFQALRSLLEAKANDWATVVSARSGETEETWLADLAVGSGAGQIKVGSTMRSDRTAKWNRLLFLEATTGLNYVGVSALAPFPAPR